MDKSEDTEPTEEFSDIDPAWDDMIAEMKRLAPDIRSATNSDDPLERDRAKLRALQFATDCLRTALDGQPVEDILGSLTLLETDLIQQLEMRTGKRRGNRMVGVDERKIRCAVIACVELLTDSSPSLGREAGPAARRLVANLLRRHGRPKLDKHASLWPSQRAVEKQIERWQHDWYEHKPGAGILSAQKLKITFAEALREMVENGDTPQDAAASVIQQVLGQSGRTRKPPARKNSD